MLKFFVLLVTCMAIMPILLAADTANPQEKHQARDSEMALTSVPLDSWVHSAFERLAEVGYFETAFFSLRSWTRFDCGRLIEEAQNRIIYEPATCESATSDMPALMRYLEPEFAPELTWQGKGAFSVNLSFNPLARTR
ncbi:MAG: hypothetical protein ABSF53_01295 [Terracidiphilus sp.]|jgi:hypothetical protein